MRRQTKKQMIANAATPGAFAPPLLAGNSDNDRQFHWVLVCTLGLFSFGGFIVATSSPHAPIPTRVSEPPPYIVKFVIRDIRPPVPEQSPAPAELPAKPARKPPSPPRTVEPPPQTAPVTRTETPDEIRARLSRTGLMQFREQLAQLQQTTLPLPQPTTAAASAPLFRPEHYTPASPDDTPDATEVADRVDSALDSPLALQSEPPTDSLRMRGSGQEPLGTRSSEELLTVLDGSKAAIYALYHRALRHNPTLGGKVVLEITIAPNGEVSECKVLSSELGSVDLERKLVAKIQLLQFEPRPVQTTVITYPIEFIPSGTRAAEE